MTAGGAHRVDHLHAQLVSQLAKLAAVELAKVFGGVDGVEQRGRRAFTHGIRPYTGFSGLSMNGAAGASRNQKLVLRGRASLGR